MYSKRLWCWIAWDIWFIYVNVDDYMDKLPEKTPWGTMDNRELMLIPVLLAICSFICNITNPCLYIKHIHAHALNEH